MMTSKEWGQRLGEAPRHRPRNKCRPQTKMRIHKPIDERYVGRSTPVLVMADKYYHKGGGNKARACRR